jgi:hypothetical protein
VVVEIVAYDYLFPTFWAFVLMVLTLELWKDVQEVQCKRI